MTPRLIDLEDRKAIPVSAKFPDHDCEIISEKPTRLRVTAGGALMAAMPDLTRRRSPDAPDECWHVFYGDVRVGTNRSATQGREGRRQFAADAGCLPGLSSSGHPQHRH